MPIIFPSPGDVSGGAPASRTLTVSSPAIPVAFGQAALEPVRLSGREGVNGLFDYELILKSPDALNADAVGAADFDLDAFVGREIGMRIHLEGSGLGLDAPGAGTREVNAMIVGADFWGEEGRYDQYRLALRPWLHLATLRTNCKVFQNQNVVQTLGRFPYRVRADTHECQLLSIQRPAPRNTSSVAETPCRGDAAPASGDLS